MVEIIISVFLVFMVIGALIALETTDLLSSVISIGAVGFALSICFLLVGAPDIAITQMVVEVLSLVILIRATIRHDLTTIDGDRDFFGLMATLALIFALLLLGLPAFLSLPPFGTPAMSQMMESPARHYLSGGLRETGAANIVASVILDYRAYDTLGEATVLFTSILGALAILRVYSRKKKS
ncbi:MAG: DUF4040 domain-containing protein [Candidatus Omnitrophica bacterium]|nr:DUF4040 domain-containing protein [Candidatus Omnitrophota bacterium]